MRYYTFPTCTAQKNEVVWFFRPKAQSEPIKTSTMELLAKIVND